MPWITWSEEMSVGVKEMDDDHKKLISILNEIHERVAAGQDKQALSGLVDQMMAGTKAHFAQEEQLLAKSGYPDVTAHYEEHDQMIAKALSACAGFRWGSTSMLSEDLLAYPRDWLIEHIQSTDKSYGAYLSAKGIQ